MSEISFHSPIGDITVFEFDGKIVAIEKGWGSNNKSLTNEVLNNTKEQILEFLMMKRTVFNLPLDFSSGTEFQQKVWSELLKVPYGETITYQELGKRIGSHQRPIGGAVGKNPIPLIIPCHRVLAKNGIGGFSGFEGVPTKKHLLNMECNYDK